MAEEGVSILETESYIVALVFLIFLVLFVATEKVRGAMFRCFCLLLPSLMFLGLQCLQLLEWRQANLTRRHKVGLLVCMSRILMSCAVQPEPARPAFVCA